MTQHAYTPLLLCVVQLQLTDSPVNICSLLYSVTYSARHSLIIRLHAAHLQSSKPQEGQLDTASLLATDICLAGLGVGDHRTGSRALAGILFDSLFVFAHLQKSLLGYSLTHISAT
jgi:hypothetical protein